MVTSVSLSVNVPHRRHPLPVGVSLPCDRNKAEKLPVILFSHGDGLTGDDYAPLADAWAKRGFAVIRPTHQTQSGQDRPAPDDQGRARLWLDRVEDMRSLIDSFAVIEQALPDAGLDKARIFAAGHSYGGHTVSLLLGAQVGLPDGGSGDLSDSRIAAGVLLAPPGGGGPEDLTMEWRVRAPYLNLDWSEMRMPALIVVGTDDISPMTHNGWTWHADPYRHSAGGNKTLLTLINADHYLGGISPGRGLGNGEILAIVRNATAAYLADKAFSGNAAWRELSAQLTNASGCTARLEQR